MSYVFSNIDLVYNTMLSQSLVYWKIYAGNSNQLILDNQEQMSVPDSVNKLKNAAENLNGHVRIALLPEKPQPAETDKPARGGNTSTDRCTFHVKLGGEYMPQNNNAGISGMGFPGGNNQMFEFVTNLMMGQFQLQMDAIKREYEFKEKIAKLEKKGGNHDYGARILNMIEFGLRGQGLTTTGKTPIAPVAPVNGTINGVEPEGELTPEEKIKEDRETVMTSLAVLANNDKDFPEKLAKLAQLKVSNPAMYDQAIEMLDKLQ